MCRPPGARLYGAAVSQSIDERRTGGLNLESRRKSRIHNDLWTTTDRPGVRFGRFELDRRSGELSKAGSGCACRTSRCACWRPCSNARRHRHARGAAEAAVVGRHVRRLRQQPQQRDQPPARGAGRRAEKPRFVETVGRRGYRFIAPRVVRRSRRRPPSAAHHRGKPLRDAARRAAVPAARAGSGNGISGLQPAGRDRLVVVGSRVAARAIDDRRGAVRVGRAGSRRDRGGARRRRSCSAGAVLRGGDRVRVSTQLVEAPRGTLLWTTPPRRRSTTCSSVPDGLVRRIVESLALPLTRPRARGAAARCARQRPGLRAVSARERSRDDTGDLGRRRATSISSRSAPIPSTRRRGRASAASTG